MLQPLIIKKLNRRLWWDYLWPGTRHKVYDWTFGCLVLCGS